MTTTTRPLFEARRGAAVPYADARARLLAIETGPVADANPWILGPTAHLTETFRVDASKAAVVGGPDSFELTDGARPIATVELDQQRCAVAVQGRWWFRGEYSIVETWEGVTVTYRVFNVATQPKWMVSVANNGFRDYESVVQREVARVAERFEAGAL